MGARGPAPTPTEQLKTRGSWRAKARETAGEPQLPAKAPGCPSWLPREAKAEWRRQVKQLLAMRVLSEADRAALACYCEAWSEFVEVCREVKGYTSPGGLGYAAAIAAGLVNAKNSAVKRLLALAAQFGFTPSARARLVAAPPQETADPFEALLNGAGTQN